jgi:stage II sporulation protein D
MKRALCLILVLAAPSFCCGCTRLAAYSVIQAAPELDQPQVAVLLGDAFDSVTVSGTGTFRVQGIGAHDDSLTYFAVAPMVIRRGMTGLMLVDRGWYVLEANLKAAYIAPHDAKSYLRVNGRSYRGELTVRPNGEKKIAVINRLGMEAYLFGVVPGEIGFSDADMVEAMAAQAVAARTYAFSHLGQYPGKDYDLRSDVMDQVYGGLAVEKPIITQAVWETRGNVLRYKGEYVKAYYHSTCAGRTERIEDVWDKPPARYLVGVDDGYCSWSNYWNWEETCSRKWLDSNVAAFLENEHLANPDTLGKLQNLEILDRLPSGRVQQLLLVFQRGRIAVRGDKSRWAFGRPSRNSAILPSANYDLEFNGDENNWSAVKVLGHGYGHGVGMCQTGAIGRARDGYKYEEILLLYYPGARLEKMD